MASANFTIIVFLCFLIIAALLWYGIFSPNAKVKKELQELEEEENILLQGNANLKEKIRQHELNLDDLERQIAQVKTVLEKYNNELHVYDVGLYQPFFNFDTSEAYKAQITQIREKQKIMVKKGKACTTVNSAKTKNAVAMALRAFNGECESLIAKVNGSNIERVRQQMEKAYEAINRLNQQQKIHISLDYFELKIKELMATYEYAVKKEEERAEQQRIKELMREEARVQREIEKAQAEAEKAKREAEKELQRAREMLERDRENSQLQARLLELEQRLQEAEERSQRAISQAQLTKSGYVYVISNIGSFGEDVYKIGMTRRLEPLDRVRELGDASVPFSFDVHALIYSEDAPALENTLHKTLMPYQVNRVNPRKEFFKVPLTNIAAIVKEHHPKAEFIMTAEALEYRQSQMIKEGEQSAT